MLPGPLRQLRGTAESEAKRLRHAKVQIPHLVIALSRDFPETVNAVWGDLDVEAIEHLLEGADRADRPDGEAPDVVEFFERVSPIDGDLLVGACAYLAPHVGLDHPPLARAVALSGATPGEIVSQAELPVAPEVFDAVAAAAAMGARVLGQDHAIERIVKRLILTMPELDNRSHRPNGVFLLAGPTGVGKTEMAKALADHLDPSGESFIRLDMSEYQNQEMSVARLVGAGPGYVGYGNKEGLLTTRVIRHPRAVVLLDEVEKADPEVWTVFLQVFDDGRLTDSMGQTADFRDTVVLLTTNIGSAAFNPNPVGIRPSAMAEQPPNPTAEVVNEIRKILPPELYNRLDETIVFNPLGIEELTAITEQIVVQSLERLASRGFDCTLAEGVTDYLARLDYDPTLGARPVQRTIERELLAAAASMGPGSYTVSLSDGALVWS